MKPPPRQLHLLPDHQIPEGLRYYDDVLTEAEEGAIIAGFSALQFQPFEFHGFQGNRRIVSCGYRYDYGQHGLRESSPIPPFLLTLREKIGLFSGPAAASFQQALVTEYAPGA